MPLISEGGGRLEYVEDLRRKLISFVRRKFYTRRNITDMAEDIVQQAFHDAAEEKWNFGYMSVSCIRAAYKVFHKNDRETELTVSCGLTAPLIAEEDFVAEVERAEDTAAIMQSLQVLKQIEQIIVRERYFGDFSFREISENHGINLNTVLSHHRRALEKLRPVLAKYFPERAPKYYYGGQYHE
jgi:RNA polymerase sigma factor (sigma-70 family)